MGCWPLSALYHRAFWILLHQSRPPSSERALRLRPVRRARRPCTVHHRRRYSAQRCIVIAPPTGLRRKPSPPPSVRHRRCAGQLGGAPSLCWRWPCSSSSSASLSGAASEQRLGGAARLQSHGRARQPSWIRSHRTTCFPGEQQAVLPPRARTNCLPGVQAVLPPRAPRFPRTGRHRFSLLPAAARSTRLLGNPGAATKP